MPFSDEASTKMNRKPYRETDSVGRGPEDTGLVIRCVNWYSDDGSGHHLHQSIGVFDWGILAHNFTIVSDLSSDPARPVLPVVGHCFIIMDETCRA